MKTQTLTWAALFRRRSFTEKHHVMELTRNSPELTTLDLIKPRTEFGQSLHSRSEATVWITELLLKEYLYGVKKKSRHRLPERRGRKWRGQRWLQLLACAVQYMHSQSHTRETAARLWNSPSGTELAHSHKKLLGPSLHFGGLATGLSLKTLIGS